MSVVVSKRERLRKIYTLKKEVVFTDEGGDFSLFVRKATPAERRDATQNSMKVRAFYLALQKEPMDNPLKIGFSEIVRGVGLDNREALTHYVCADEIIKARISVEERIAHEERWAKDDYLASLQEAWEDGLRERFQRDEEDEEAILVLDALKRYLDEVEEEYQAELADIVAPKEDWSDEKLLEAAVNRFIERQASNEQNLEVDKWIMYFCTYADEECRERYFESREDVDAQPDVFQRLLSEYNEMLIDPLEGKD